MKNNFSSDIFSLKEKMKDLMLLVKHQLTECKAAFLTQDKAIAEEIRVKEKMVNNMELEIDRACENILALYQPVAIDLRFILASIKINSDLERLGDHADGIAKYILQVNESFSEEELKEIRFEEMFDTALMMIDLSMRAFLKEDTNLSREVFLIDQTMNEINIEAPKKTAGFIKSNTSKTYEYMYLLSIIRKLERVGDLCKNISEEVIFYLEAKVLKHQKDQID